MTTGRPRKNPPSKEEVQTAFDRLSHSVRVEGWSISRGMSDITAFGSLLYVAVKKHPGYKELSDFNRERNKKKFFKPVTSYRGRTIEQAVRNVVTQDRSGLLPMGKTWSANG